MKALPPGATAYRRQEWSDATLPAGLLRRHATKAGVWGRLRVLEGTLEYRILEPTLEVHTLVPGHDGVIEPEVAHEVAPRGAVRFTLEFLREG